MSSSTQPSDIIIGRTFGALFIGVTIAAVLFGLSCVQSFVYFQTHRDPGTTFYKLVVICLWILDALHLAFIVHCVYYYLVSNYANITAPMDVVWSFKLQILFEVLIIQGVHSLYLYRIWIVSQGRSRILPIIVGIVIMSNSGVAIALIWALYQCSMFSELNKIEWATFLTLGTITFADVVIASSLCYLLATSRTEFSSTNSLITRLMVYIINTGCLTSMCSMAAIITCAVMPTNFIFVAIEFLLAKLYVNSYLALLNARYYTEVNTDTNNSDTFHNRHGVYRPELHVRALDDDELQVSRKDLFKHLDDTVHPSRSVKEPALAVTTEMNSFSSV
ncbi:hypothetical protein DFJ58DRAFT_246500 [Suillus subalutaceus]|uniref:uncharacterized protein n=1 Tax=Suillus subalutaceus TaxID=48586 RepID=UPI001B8744B6|nr:uncharacterized protein DFJ58DRAFT_246500 [Suillus subalutaceus]KAG1861773.1 hypothetical protein DFJ58DRAFT_246500 [Suillus subalutaceus]